MAKKQTLTKTKNRTKKAVAPVAADRQQGPGAQYDNWIVWLSFAVLIAMPLIVSRISYDQFDLAKLAAFRVLVLGMVIAWAAKLLTTREPFRWSWREGLLAAFLLAAVVSTFTSIHIPTSLHGKYKRYEGLLTFITYITMYFAVAQSFKGKKRLQTMIEIISLVGGFVAFYGVLQFIGLDPVDWGKVPFEERRSFSTFGNPDLLAGYLVLAFPCSIVAYFHDHKRAWLHGVSAFFLATGLLTALTRGGWLGALVGAVCLAALLGRSLKLYWKKVLFLVAPIALALTATVAYSSATHLDIVAKFRGAFQLNSGTALGRFEIWKSGWLMVKDRPLFGQGLDTFRLASERFETLRYVQSVQGGTVSDNAHNYFIQLAAGGGPLAALLIYGFFVAWIVRMIIVRRRLADDMERLLLGGVIAAVVGYLATMLVGISIVGASSTFWLLLATATGFSAKLDPAYRSFDFARLAQGVKLAAVVFLIVVTVAGAGFAVTMYAGDITLVKGLIASGAGDEARAAANFNAAFRLYPANGRIMSEMGQAYYRWGSAAGQQKDEQRFKYSMQQAINAFERASLAEPPEVDYRVFLANTYGATGQYDRAIAVLAKVLEQRPHSVSAHQLSAGFMLARDRKPEAIKHYEAILRVIPNSGEGLGRMVALQKEVGNESEAARYQKLLDKLPPAE